LLAIDLGEKRIGYCIYDVQEYLRHGKAVPAKDDAGKQLYGSIAVPSVRKLMKAVKSHRKRGQPNQKVSQTYSTALLNFRENVIGDICNRIDTLCAEHSAFPVLEHSVRNFESGSRQLEMVYGSILQRYTFSQVDAHTAKRKEHWFTGEHWDHPYLMARTWKERTKNYTGTPKPLVQAPGVTVNAAGTSQRCHQCGRNPMPHLLSLRKEEKRIEVKSDGLIDLDDGTIRLLESSKYTAKEIRLLRHQKLRPALNVPLQEGKHKSVYVYSVAKRNLRRPTESVMSGDTSQARYFCLYNDCTFTGHADENAAINIGWRYLTERIDADASRKKLGELKV
jgi:hypothetical protein